MLYYIDELITIMIHNIKDPFLNTQYLLKIYNYNKNFIDSHKMPDIICYCLIRHFRGNCLSISFHIKNDKNIDQMITFKAKSAQVLCKLIGLHNKIDNILSTTHTLYIGMELMKAELTMITGQSYIQN